MDPRRDRARGALLGLAVGDALGTTLEFAMRDSLPTHTEMTGGGPYGLEPGLWTDDTSLALALGDSLVACRGFDATDLIDRFVAWWRRGDYSSTGVGFGIGETTACALRRFEASRDPFAGSTLESEAGNGSLMRLAPVALLALDDAARADDVARAQSRVTHGASQAVEACAFLVQILREAVLGAPDPLRRRPWSGHPAIAAIAADGWRNKARDAIRSSGYVVDTLEAALWSVAGTGTFEAALVLAVNLAGDADTIGAVTGQIAGALHGAAAIPARWLDRLAWRDVIVDRADALLAARPNGV